MSPVTIQRQELTKKIMLFEDNPVDVIMIRRALAQAGIPFAATVIENGEKALNYVTGGLSGDTPDLMIIDLNLPMNDGFEILAAIKKNPALADVPCAILTSSTSDRDRDKAKQLGAGEFVSKPLDMDDFLKTGLIFKSLIEGRKRK